MQQRQCWVEGYSDKDSRDHQLVSIGVVLSAAVTEHAAWAWMHHYMANLVCNGTNILYTKLSGQQSLTLLSTPDTSCTRVQSLWHVQKLINPIQLG